MRTGLSIQNSFPSFSVTPGNCLMSSSSRAPSLRLKASGLNTTVSPRMTKRLARAVTTAERRNTSEGFSAMSPKRSVSLPSKAEKCTVRG